MANEPQCGYFFVRFVSVRLSMAGRGKEAFGLADGHLWIGTSHFVMRPPPHWEVRSGYFVYPKELI